MDRGPMSLPTNNARVDCGPPANQARRTTARIAQEGVKGKEAPSRLRSVVPGNGLAALLEPLHRRFDAVDAFEDL